MGETTIKSPAGRDLHLVATKSTTPSSNNTVKHIDVARETVEVLVSDSRIISKGSQFGHVAISIDGTVYGRAHPGWDIAARDAYLKRQQINMHRATWGYVLMVSKEEKAKMLADIKKRAAANEPYSLDSNSCSSNIAEVLEFAGIPAYDPRWSGFTMISPADLMVGLSHSRRLIQKNTYAPK
ncbi:DUF4105 domain-containing protein [Aquitalea magnusonii]|uniref:DUF4105 domain-containing protein n=1 Tax=Aquitalea magnusonii TaxID=332411 RepID=UPI000B5C5906|nr:DUF4105 domain-containing protein [Aquitalea magnusonii]